MKLLASIKNPVKNRVEAINSIGKMMFDMWLSWEAQEINDKLHPVKSNIRGCSAEVKLILRWIRYR